MGEGIFALALLVMIAPFVVVRNYFQKIGMMPPAKAAVTKASDGVGLIGLGLWLLIVRDDIGLTSFGQGVGHPQAVLLVPVALGGFGLWWLVHGWQDAREYGQQPGVQSGMGGAAVRIALAVAAFSVLCGQSRPQFIDPDWWSIIVPLQWVIRAVSVWLFLTGAGKIAVLLATRSRPSRAPTFPQPRNRQSGPASPRQAMQGRGGKTSRMDQQEF